MDFQLSLVVAQLQKAQNHVSQGYGTFIFTVREAAEIPKYQLIWEDCVAKPRSTSGLQVGSI